MRALATLLTAGLALLLSACQAPREELPARPAADGPRAEAVFAGGCFWCSESDFEHLPGVYDAVSGYTGGTLDNPSYQDVVTETTGHYESVRVIYNPDQVTYPELVEYLLRHVDPLDAGGQFCDRGPSYRAAIFVADEEQRAAAEAVKQRLSAELGRPIVTEILPLGPFWQAEDYHQAYYEKNPLRYSFYRSRCGRDARVAEVWGGHAAEH